MVLKIFRVFPSLSLLVFLIIAGFVTTVDLCIAADKTPVTRAKLDKEKTLKNLCSELKKTLINAPELTITCDSQASKILFNSKPSKIYSVRIPNMMGKLQRARQVKGPSKGGFLGEVSLIEGDTRLYQAIYPQSFPFFYERGKTLFTEWGWAPYSKKYDSHLKAKFSCPEGDISPKLKQFEKFIQDWQSCAVLSK